MRFLLASTALGAFTILPAAPAAAEQVISTAVTTPVTTSGAGDNVRISSTGSVKPASGAAVAIDSNNSVKNEGIIAIQGADGSTGILANTNLAGDITNTNTITIDETFTATGYRYTTAPADPSKLDSDDLLQGGSAVIVGGNVAGGILLDTRPADSDPNDADEDDDGITDTSETAATIVSFGSAPAMVIGSSTQDVAVGPGAAARPLHQGIHGGKHTAAGQTAPGRTDSGKQKAARRPLS